MLSPTPVLPLQGHTESSYLLHRRTALKPLAEQYRSGPWGLRPRHELHRPPQRPISRLGSERVIQYAMKLAMKRPKGAPSDDKRRVTCVDKSNVLIGDQLFRRIFNETAQMYSNVVPDYAYVDAWTMWSLRQPEYYNVVVAPNIYGDIISDLGAHLERIRKLHQSDLKNNYQGVFLPGALERKYRNAAKEFVWQWFFPAIKLTYVPETNERKRYHLHESNVHKILKIAVRKTNITKRVSSHTFRHSFASHLLQANYDIRTIQELLGHSDVRTTMIYTHTIKSQTLKEAKSPLDF